MYYILQCIIFYKILKATFLRRITIDNTLNNSIDNSCMRIYIILIYKNVDNIDINECMYKFFIVLYKNYIIMLKIVASLK